MEDLSNDAVHKETVRLWRAWRTVHEMVADREYELGDDEVKISLDHFKSQFCVGEDGAVDRHRLQFTARPSEAMIRKNAPPPKKNPTTGEVEESPSAEVGPVWVEFLHEKQFGVAQIRKFASFLVNNNYQLGIMVTPVALSPAARKALQGIEAYTKVECFLEADLLVNITHHELVPKHVLLSRDEKIALLKRYRLKETQLPRILSSDPVAKYLGLRRGQVVKIIRNSETAGRYASYRLCIGG